MNYDQHSYERNLSNCVKKPQKVRISTGFEPVTSRYRCAAPTNWAMKVLTLEIGHLWVLIATFHILKYFIYWTADLKNPVEFRYLIGAGGHVVVREFISYNGPHAFLLHLPTPSSYLNFCSFFYHRDNNCSRFEKVPRSNHSLKKICVSFSIVTPKNGFKEDKSARTCRPTYAFPCGSTFPRVKGKRVTG